MSGIVVHVGPSLPAAARPPLPGALWRPPAAAGDALRAEREGCAVFVLIDGVFDAACAIRHNELLRLLAAGVRVVGAASMGALRAAELHGFGMEGAGAVFRAYATGRLMGDDEVALLHAPEALGWTPLTVPLVNLRATLVQARRERRIGREAARRVLARGAALPFDARDWDRVLQGLDFPDPFRVFVAAGGVDLKRRDALEALALAATPRPPPQRPAPPHSDFSAALMRRVFGEAEPH